jgi:nucleoside recognition membrane protein YjiH
MKGFASLILVIGIIMIIQAYYITLLNNEKTKNTKNTNIQKIPEPKTYSSTIDNQFKSTFELINPSE